MPATLRNPFLRTPIKSPNIEQNFEEFIYDDKKDEKVPRYRFVEDKILNDLPEILVERLFRAYASLSIEAQNKIKESVIFDGESLIEEIDKFEKEKSEEYYEEKIKEKDE